MPRFSVLWLFSLTTILAVLFAVAGQSLQYAFLLSCLTLACYAGFASRFLFMKSHVASLTIAVSTSIMIGGFLLAVGSRYLPVSPGAIDVVNDHGQSIVASFFVGATMGYCFSIIPMLTYAVFVGCKGFRRSEI